MRKKYFCVASLCRLVPIVLVLLTLCGSSFALAESYSEQTKKIRKRFVRLAAQWQVHSREISMSSRLSDYLALPEYKELVKLGKPAIPLIMPLLKKSCEDRQNNGNGQDYRWWTFLLEDITGIKRANRHSFDGTKEEEFWLNWWRDQQSKAVDP